MTGKDHFKGIIWNQHDGEELTWLDYANLKASSDKSVLFDLGDEEVWIPKSLINDIGEENQEVEVLTWKVDELGLI